jgi:cell wall-associated NlpC family hydrolase
MKEANTQQAILINQLQRKVIVTAARSQLNVKYIKDARTPFAGLDCIGLISFSYGQIFPQAQDVPIQGFCGGFTDDRLLKHLESYNFKQTTLDDAQPGDIVVWTYKEVPHHTGILTEKKGDMWWVIHACAKYKRVTEHSLSAEWDYRYHSVWTLTN